MRQGFIDIQGARPERKVITVIEILIPPTSSQDRDESYTSRSKKSFVLGESVWSKSI